MDNYQYQQPSAEPAPPKGSRYAVIGPWGFIGYNIVMAIPLIGFIMAIVWACSKTGSIQRRNYARAFLIMMILAVIFSVVASVLWWSAISQFINTNTY